MSDQDPECTCGYLQDAAINPDSPVSFDEEMGEFHVDHRLILHYCPLCGGRAPVSIRKSLFAIASKAEGERLKGMVSGLKSLQDVRQRFGSPDRECEQEWTSPGTCEVHHVRRALEYMNLSETAVVIFVERLDDNVDLLYHGKYIGK